MDWRKSSRSYGTGDCVEVCFVNQMAAGNYLSVIIEDSSHRVWHDRVIVNDAAWRDFIARVKSGQVLRDAA